MAGYTEQFEENSYPPIFLELAQETIQQFGENSEKIIKEIQNKLSWYMEQIVTYQREDGGESAAEMTISFLYTSLEEEPGFRIDCYGEEGRVFGESMKTEFLPASWLTAGLDKFMGRLERCVKEEGLRQYVRPAELEILKLRAVRSLLYYFSGRFKYILEDALDKKLLAKIEKAESFVISIGEYQDWQKAIYAVLPEVDIFNCEPDTVLRFRSFPAKYYKDKTFDELILNQSTFYDCTFIESEIDNCKMNDCIFDHCRFEHVTIMDTQMAGALFIDCTFQDVEFFGVAFDGEAVAEQEEEYFEPAEFYQCSFNNSIFHACEMEQVVWTECSEEEGEQ